MASRISIEVLADTRRLRSGLSESGRQLSGFRKTISGVGSALRGFLGAAAVVKGFQVLKDGIKDSIDQASDLDENLSKVNEIFGDGADEIAKWSEGASKAFGQSRNQALEAASTFAVFGKSAGLAGDDLTGFATGLTELASDLASFHNTEPQEAIDALGAALRGESEPMRKFGVLLDDASLRAEALKQGLISSTKEALTPQQKVLAAHALIMEQTADAQGDFARTSGGLANMQRQLAARMDDVKTKVGTALLPIVLALATAFQQHVLPQIERFADWFAGEGAAALQAWGAELGARLLPALRDLGEVAKSELLPAVMQLALFFAENADTILRIVAAVLPAIASFAALQRVLLPLKVAIAAVNLVMALNPIGAVVIAVTALVAGLVLAYQSSETFRRIVDRAFRAVADAARVLIDWVRGIPGWFRDMARSTARWIGNARDAVTGAITRMWNAIRGFGSNIVSSIRNAWRSFTSAVRQGVRHAIEWVRWFPGEAIYQLARFGQRIFNAGWDLIMGLVRGITGAIGRAVEAVKSAGSAVLRGIKSVFGIRSPSREFQKVGFDLVRGLIVGMSKVAGVRKAASGLAREVSEGFGVPELRMAAVGVPGGSRDAVGARTYNLTVNVAPGGSPVETGRQIVRAIEAFERANGGRR